MIFLPKDYQDPEPVNVNAPATRWLTYLIFAASLVVYYLFPVWAGIFTEAYGFNGK